MTDQGKLHRKNTFGKSPEPLIHDMRISHGAARLYAHMHWRYGENHSNFEGTLSMAETFEVSQNTICNWIKELESHDWVVTVVRDRNENTGNYRTPFYHVFEDKFSCAVFRSTYKPQEGEYISPKPEPKERKTRKGKGGKPSHKVTAQTQVGLDTDPTQVGQAHPTQVRSINIQTQVIQTHQEELLRNSSDDDGQKPKKKKKNPVTVPKKILDEMKNRIALKFYGGNDNVTETEWKRINKVSRELCLANRKPDDVDVIYDYCSEKFDNFTVNALAAHASAALSEKDSNKNESNPSPDRAKFFRQYRAEITTNENAGMYADKPAPSFAEWCKQRGLKM